MSDLWCLSHSRSLLTNVIIACCIDTWTKCLTHKHFYILSWNLISIFSFFLITMFIYSESLLSSSVIYSAWQNVLHSSCLLIACAFLLVDLPISYGAIHTIVLEPLKQSQRIWVDQLHESLTNDYIITKQTTTKLFAYCMVYTTVLHRAIDLTWVFSGIPVVQYLYWIPLVVSQPNDK